MSVDVIQNLIRHASDVNDDSHKRQRIG
jgi:hypothetical protein